MNKDIYCLIAGALIGLALLTGCGRKAGQLPRYHSVKSGVVTVSYTDRVSEAAALKYATYLKAMGEKVGLDYTNFTFVLDLGDVYQIKHQVNPGVENDPKAIQTFKVNGKLAARFAFDYQRIEVHLMDSGHNTVRVIVVDPAEDMTSEANFNGSDESPQGAIKKLLDSVQAGKYEFGVAWYKEATLAIPSGKLEWPEASLVELRNLRCYARSRFVEGWFAKGRFAEWKGAKAYFGEVVDVEENIVRVDVVIDKHDGTRNCFPTLVAKDGSGLLSLMMIEPELAEVAANAVTQDAGIAEKK